MALFKIFNNIDNPQVKADGEPRLPDTYNKGYMYFDANTNIFYIDTAGTGGTTGTRVKVNSWGSTTAYADENQNRISTTYLKINTLVNTNTLTGVAETPIEDEESYVSAVRMDHNGKLSVVIPRLLGAYTSGDGVVIDEDGVIGAQLKSTTKLTVSAGAVTTTNNQVIPVVMDKDGYLAVSLPIYNGIYTQS